MDSNKEEGFKQHEEPSEKKLDFNSMTSSDIDKLFPELNIKDVSGRREGQTLITFSQKPKVSLKEMEDEIRRRHREYNKLNPPTLDELM